MLLKSNSSQFLDLCATYDLLWEHLPKEKFTFGFSLPHTLCFLGNNEIKWYFSSKKHKNILRKNRGNVNPQIMKKVFEKRKKEKVKVDQQFEIFCIKITCYEQKYMKIENLNKEEFLNVIENYKYFKRSEQKFVIQKFVGKKNCFLKVKWERGNFIIEELASRDYLKRSNSNIKNFVNSNLARRIKFMCLKIETRISYITLGYHELNKMEFICRILDDHHRKIEFVCFSKLQTTTTTYKGKKIQNFNFSVRLKSKHIVKYKENMFEDNIMECALCKQRFEKELMVLTDITKLLGSSYGIKRSFELSFLMKVIFPSMSKRKGNSIFQKNRSKLNKK